MSMRKTGGWLAVWLLAATGFGQGTKADYARAAALPEKLKPLANERIEPTWLSGSQLIYREGRGDGQHRYRLVDGTRGEGGDAFDHARVATQLATLLKREVSGDALPLARFALQGETLLALIEQPLRVVAIDPRTSTVREQDLEATDAFSLRPARGRRSRDRGGDTSVLFHNGTDETVELFWLDRGGQPRKYATLQPGEQHRQHTFHGHVWLVRGRDGRELGLFEAGAKAGLMHIQAAGDAGDETKDDPEPEPDYLEIVNHNLVRVQGDTRTQLTTDGTEADRYSDTFTWSPDRRFVLVVRRTPPEEHTVHLIEAAPRDQVQPKLVSYQYLKPGDQIAGRYLALVDVEAKRTLEIDRTLLPNAWSLDRLHWSSDGEACYVLFNQRGHQLLRVLAVDRNGKIRSVLDEASETFVDYAGKLYLQHLEDENSFLWMSERSGWNHLYRVDRKDGSIRAITQGEWVVRGVEKVDVERREILFRALGPHAGQDPYHVHYGRVGFDGGPVTWLTRADGTHTIGFSPDRSHYVATHSRVDLPPVHTLHRAADGKQLLELCRASADPYLAQGWRFPERFVSKGRDGKTDIWGVLFYPSNFDPQQRYPVIENIYAGPHSHFVPKSFRAWHGSRRIAELGFIVVRIDGMGTNWRSKAFHDVCWKNLGDSGFADRRAWIEAAGAKRPFMDLSRVGIFGGSAGGQSALRAMLTHGDFYHAAVADCGCHDNRMDKIWWNELWMGWPIGDHYEAQSNVTNAHKLQGALMLVVGAMDRNVDPASTMQVVDALIQADKDFDLLVMPSAGHGAAESPYGRRRRQDFFVRELLGVEPRSE